MNVERVNALLHEIDDNALRAEVREFAMRPLDEQLVQLYLEMKSRPQPKPLLERMAVAGGPIVLALYALFDQRDNIPPMGGR